MDKKESEQIINQTIADYNLISAKFSSTRRNLSQDLIDLGSQVGSKDDILDYGCGNGRLCQLFKPDQYLGVDASEELVDIARKLHPDYTFNLVKPSVLPVGKTFNVVFCLSVIHHLPDENCQLELLRNIHHSLSRSGKLVLLSWNIDSSDSIVSIPFKTEQHEIVRNIFSFSLDHLRSLIELSGFSILSSRIAPRNSGRHSNLEVIAQKN